MKNKIYALRAILILSFSFLFLYKSVNNGYPKEVKIEEYSYKEKYL